MQYLPTGQFAFGNQNVGTIFVVALRLEIAS